MKIKKYLFTTSILALTLLTGCSLSENLLILSNNIKQVKELEYYEWMPEIKNDTEIFLFDKFDQRIATYDTINHNIIQKNNTINYLQFEFNNLKTNIYSAGHSEKNNYKIIKMDNKKIITLYETDKNTALFPLAYENCNNMYFIKSIYEENGAEIYEKRILCSFNEKTKQLTEIPDTLGMRITHGTIIDGVLYFTAYDTDVDKFSLYTMNTYNTEKPNLLSKNLIAGEIYNNNNVLWISDQTHIYTYPEKTNTFSKKALNYFYNDKLYQIDTSSNNDLELFITDINTKKLENNIEGIIDVRFSNDKIQIYTTKKIITL